MGGSNRVSLGASGLISPSGSVSFSFVLTRQVVVIFTVSEKLGAIIANQALGRLLPVLDFAFRGLK